MVKSFKKIDQNDIDKLNPPKIRITSASSNPRFFEATVVESRLQKMFADDIHRSLNNLKKSVYGLTEINMKNLSKGKIIACPGCYPTSILLPLFPLIKKNLIDFKNIVIDSKSGFSGAGRGVHKKFKNKNLYGSTSAYGIGSHRHNACLLYTSPSPRDRG